MTLVRLENNNFKTQNYSFIYFLIDADAWVYSLSPLVPWSVLFRVNVDFIGLEYNVADFSSSSSIPTEQRNLSTNYFHRRILDICNCLNGLNENVSK